MNYDTVGSNGVLYFKNGTGDWEPFVPLTFEDYASIETMDQTIDVGLNELLFNIHNGSWEFSMRLLHPNPKVNWLAKHGKERVRKKNQKRILKYWSRKIQTLL